MHKLVAFKSGGRVSGLPIDDCSEGLLVLGATAAAEHGAFFDEE